MNNNLINIFTFQNINNKISEVLRRSDVFMLKSNLDCNPG